MTAGPLAGIRVVELGALGPAPFCAMILADLGADVLRIERPDRMPIVPNDASRADMARWDLLSRNRPCVTINLKSADGAAVVTDLAARADVFIEGFRPGVAERLGVGPEQICGQNDRLVYGRMTGWGRSGPLSDRPGHDINYLAQAGVLAHIGRHDQAPTAPLNLVADFGGGGMLLAMGICAALVERATSGRGQIVDAAMVDGAALLMTPLFGATATGFWSDERGTNLLDTGAPFYDCYECSDGRFVAVGAIEPSFFEALVSGLGLSDHVDLSEQHDPGHWPMIRRSFADAFLARSRDEWSAHFSELGACVSPVLTMSEAMIDDDLEEWGTFIDVDGARQPAPAPRFSRTPTAIPRRPSLIGENTDEALIAWGVAESDLVALRAAGAIR